MLVPSSIVIVSPELMPREASVVPEARSSFGAGAGGHRVRLERCAGAGDGGRDRGAGDRIGLEAARVQHPGGRIARDVGLVLDRRRCLRRHEIVVELQHLRNAADGVPGRGVDRDAHEIIAGAVDQISALVELKIAGAGIIIDAVELRLIVGEADRLLDHEVAVAVDRHIGRDRRALDRSLHRVGGDGIDDDAAGRLLLRPGRGDQIGEARVGFLVARGLRVGDVAGNVLQRIGLRLQTGDGGSQRIENTHDIISDSDSERGAAGHKRAAAISSRNLSKRRAIAFGRFFNELRRRHGRAWYRCAGRRAKFAERRRSRCDVTACAAARLVNGKAAMVKSQQRRHEQRRKAHAF